MSTTKFDLHPGKCRNTAVLGIDPGPKTTGVALFDAVRNKVRWSEQKMKNADVLQLLLEERYDFAAVECIEAIYSPFVGADTVRTIRYIGRLEEALGKQLPRTKVCFLSPQRVRMIVTGTAAAKDPGVRQALIDKIGPAGRKAEPGPTYGVSSHAWRALAVAYAALHRGSEGFNLLEEY